MPGKFEAPRGQSRRKKQNKKAGVPPLLLVLALLAAMVLGFWLVRSGLQGNRLPEDGTASGTETTGAPAETTQPQQEFVVSTATIGAMGDLLMHKTIFDYPEYNATCDNQDGTYDFSTLFQYLTPYSSPVDYMVANLETTLGGEDFPYQGNPAFNCPDEILDAVKAAGFDMLLTANNHSYDTLMPGLKRTLEQTRGQGMDTLGTRLSEEEARYTIVEVNGIRIGMVCYTYTLKMDGNKPNLNYNTPVEQPELINYFDYNAMSAFYSELGRVFAEMEEAGAEATMLYIHWGNEYELTESATQNTIAQKICDMGFDVIVGGHPHVVQPMEMLESTVDPAHKTLCLYSLGNAVSNQRLGKISRITTAHTEDGMLATVTFEKYADGTVQLAGVDVLPTWVNMFTNEKGKNEYNILPLDKSKEDQWQELFVFGDPIMAAAQASYERTMAIVGPGLSECQAYLAKQRQAREDAFVMAPAA